MRSAEARSKCETWPCPSGAVAGMPSAYRRKPRTPKVERAPKPRMEICRSCAKFWRLSATTPGTRTSDSDRLTCGCASWMTEAGTTSTEAGVSKASCATPCVGVTTMVRSVPSGGVCAEALAAASAATHSVVLVLSSLRPLRQPAPPARGSPARGSCQRRTSSRIASSTTAANSTHTHTGMRFAGAGAGAAGGRAASAA